MKVTQQLLESLGFKVKNQIKSEILFNKGSLDIIIYPYLGKDYADHMMINGKVYLISGMSFESVNQWVYILTNKWIKSPE